MKAVDQMLGTGGIGEEGRSDYRSDNALFEECRGGVYSAESRLGGKGVG